MNFEEHAAKAHVLAPAGIADPAGASLRERAGRRSRGLREIGPCVVKAQVPTGKRGKAGGISSANSAGQAGSRAAPSSACRIGGHPSSSVLIEEQVKIAREFYAAMLHDTRGAHAARPVLEPKAAWTSRRSPPTQPRALTPHRRHRAKASPADDRARDAGAASTSARRKAQSPTSWRNSTRVFARDRRRTGRDQSACAARRRARCRARLQIRPRRCRRLPPAGSRTPRRSRASDRAGAARRGSRPQAHPARRRCRRARQRRRADDDDHGRDRHFGGQPANFLEIGGEAYTKARRRSTSSCPIQA